MNRYVSVTGTNSGPGDEEHPWATVIYAGLNAVSGDTVFVNSGNYSGGVAPVANEVAYIAIGTVTVDSGAFCCFDIEGKNNILISGFTFHNEEGDGVYPEVSGIGIRDAGMIAGTGSHHITIVNCTFSGINRNESDVNSYGAPIIVYSLADERLGHTNCHHIIIKNCTFLASVLDTQSGIYHDNITVTGNTENVLIFGNSFYHDYSIYSIGAGFIVLAGNQSTAYPDQPRKIVVSNNTIELTGPIDYNRSFPYFGGAADVLCERNISTIPGNGIFVLCEKGLSNYGTTERVWYRRNLVHCYANGITAGTFADNYRSPKDIWCSNNTCIKSYSIYTNINFISGNTTDSPEGLLGDCRFFNNVFSGTPDLLDQIGVVLDHNDWANYGPRVSNIDTAVPSWYTPGQFGDYEPVLELDINGSPCKYCRGAEERIWGD